MGDFIQFNPGLANALNDTDYLNSSYRQNGAVTGIAPSNVHNKLFYQFSTFATAFAQAMKAKGYTMSDAVLADLKAEFEGVVTSKGENITVTVGTGGDYATINAALAALSVYYPLYVTAGFTATIQLLTGFVMAEQVLVKGMNLSWVRITSVDALVTIQRSALTTNFSGLYPAFGVGMGALPRLCALFSMDATGLATSREGIYVSPGGVAYVEGGCGVRSAGGCGINCVTGLVYATDSDFRNAGRICAFADYGGTVVVTGATLSGGGVYGVYAGNGSNIIADLANCQRGGSPAATDINTYMGSRVTALNATGGLSQTANTLTSHGIIFR